MNTLTELVCPQNWLDRTINIVLVGAGGTGSNVFDTLVQLHHGLLGVGHEHGLHVTLFDDDVVDTPNIGRQRFVHADIGHNKAKILINRYNLAFGLDWCARPERFEEQDMSRHLDCLITCVDNIKTRRMIGKACKKVSSNTHHFNSDSLWLDFGNGQSDGQVILGHAYKNENRIPNVYDLYPELDTKKENNQPSCSLAEAIRHQDLYINRTIADAGINLLWQLLRKGKINHHGVFVNLQSSEAKPLMINTEVWEFMGYTA